jgi:hypothetical protein
VTLWNNTKSTLSLYSLIWDFLSSQIHIWTTTTWSNVWVVLPKPSWYDFLNWVPDMNTCFKVYASYNILRYLCAFIHVLIFVPVSKCRKSPKLTNIVIIAIITMLTMWCVQACGLNSRWIISMSRPMIYEREIWQQRGRLNWAHPFPKVLGSKRGSDIASGNIAQG